MKLYVWITQDRLQLPLYVSEHVEDMSRVSGYKAGSIYTIVSKARRGLLERPAFIKVEVDNG